VRRALLLLALVVAVALLAWFALSGGADDDAAGRKRTAEEIAAEEAAAEAARRRANRERTPEAAAADPDAGLSPFLRAWPEIGQDREQDPALAALTGRVLATRESAPSECVVEAVQRGVPVARVRVRGKTPFHLKNVPTGVGIGVTARAEGYAPGGVDKLILHAGETLDLGTVYLGAAIDPDVDNRVEVRVVTDDKPVPGAQVTATSVFYGSLLLLGHMEKQPGGTVLRAVTDGAGVASFEKLPPAAYDVFAEADGYSFEVQSRVLLQRKTRTTVVLELEPGRTISGRAQTAEGAPIAGARVASLRWGSFTNVPPTETDAEGKFTVRGLVEGNYFVVVAKMDYGVKDLQNVAAGTQDLVVVIDAGGDLVVRATDATTGAPVPSFGLRPFRKIPFAYLYSPLFEVRAADGVGRVRLPASDYGMEVTADGYALLNVTTVPFPSKEPFEAKLEPSGVVRGRVVARGSRKPIRGASVFVKRGGFPPSKVKDQQTVTDAEGLFTLAGLPRRAFTLWISHVDHDEKSFEGVEPAAVAPGAQPETREFELGEGGRIEGRVVLPGGVPAPDQAIQLSAGFDFMSARSTTTGADGTYAFVNVPPGPKYTVSVGQFAPGRPGKSKSDVVVTDGGVTVVDFGTDVGGQRLLLRVTRDEKPAPGVSVTLVSDDGGPTFEQGRTKDDGTFAFENVTPGRYVVRAMGAASRTTSVTVKAEEPPAEVLLALVASTITGRVTDAASGQPLSGAWVECDLVIDGGGSSLADLVKRRKGQATTGGDGAYRFQGLEEGTFEVRATRDGYGTEVSDRVTLAAGGTAEGVVLAMGPACTLSGMVKNAQGVPIEGAAVQLRDSRGRPVYFISLTQTSSDGNYTQASLRPDTYEVTIEKEGYAPARQSVAVGTSGGDRAAKLDATLLQGGRIDVFATTADGAAVKDATVTLVDAQGQTVTRGVTLSNIFSLDRNRTDAQGRVRVAGVAAGTYKVVVAVGERRVERPGVEVLEAGVTPVEVTLPAGE